MSANQLETSVKNLQRELPDVISTFGRLHHEVIQEGVIDAKYKRLMAVSVSVALRCDNCIQTHVSGAIGAGASRREILEAAGVGILMAGGPAMSFSATVLMEIMDDLGIE